jgi:hypothetical protein
VIERYALVRGRIRQELEALRKIVERAERALGLALTQPEQKEFYLDSVALSLHDFYVGLERVFQHVASQVDRGVPSGHDSHRELLHQMTLEIPEIRPALLSSRTATALDEYLRFRHIVRNVYAFQFDDQRIQGLVQRLRPCFDQTKADLDAFADFLARLGREVQDD